jgi:hypothetical protein
MRFHWIAVPALIGALFTSTTLAFADAFPTSGEVPECAAAPGKEVCHTDVTEKCTSYKMTELKVGLHTVYKQECAERTVTKKYLYWQEP